MYCNYIYLQCVSVKIQINIVSEYLLKIVEICKRDSAVVVRLKKRIDEQTHTLSLKYALSLFRKHPQPNPRRRT